MSDNAADRMTQEEERQKRRWNTFARALHESRVYDEWRQHPVRKAVDKVYVELVSGDRILEIGCGSGHLLGAFLAMQKRPDYIGMDISIEMLRLARTKGLTALVCGSGNSLPFRDGSFDTVVAGHWVFRYLEAELALTEAYRVLRKGGELLFDVPLYWRSALEAFGEVVRGKHSWAEASVKARLDLNVRKSSVWASRVKKVGFELISRIGILDLPGLTARLSWAPRVYQCWAHCICAVLFIHARRPVGTSNEGLKMAATQSCHAGDHVLAGLRNVPDMEVLLDVMMCPTCQRKLTLRMDRLTCENPACGRDYHVEDGIPMMLCGKSGDYSSRMVS